MKQIRHEIGMVDSKQYKLVYDRRGNQQACDYRYAKEWRWFLWVDGYYQGDFRLKREALKYIKDMPYG